MPKFILDLIVGTTLETCWKEDKLLQVFPDSNDQYRCSAEDILLEMDRILRPEGTVIFRDQVGVLMQVRRIVRGMRWNTKLVDHEDGPLVSEKVLFAVKQYWVAGDNTTSSK